jgi:hypothetical protein
LLRKVQREIFHLHLAEDARLELALWRREPYVIVVQVPDHVGHDLEQLIVSRLRSDTRPIDFIERVPVDVLDAKQSVVAIVGLPQMLEVLLGLAQFLRGSEPRNDGDKQSSNNQESGN